MDKKVIYAGNLLLVSYIFLLNARFAEKYAII